MPARSANRNRFILLCAVAAFSISVLVGLGNLVHQGLKARGEMRELVFWSAAQTELEYWRFLNTLDRYALGVGDVTRDDVTTRLDILWSRIALYENGPTGERLNRIPDTHDIIVGLTATLNAVEAEIQGLPRGNGALYRKVRAQLAAHVVPLRVLAQRTNRTEQAEAVDMHRRTMQAQELLIGFMVGVLVSGALLITLLLREERRARSFAQDAMQARRIAVRHGEHVQKIVETVDDGIVAVDPDGIIENVNSAGEAMFGIPASELTGSPLLSRLTEDSLRAYFEFSARCRGDVKAGVGERLEVNLIRADGSIFPAEISVGEMVEGKRRTYVVVIRDLSEKKQTQIQLLHAQKLDAMGKLTGEVAHEFNNLLTAISGFAQMAQRSLDDKARLQRCLSEVVSASDQAAALTGQMLAFGRKQTLDPRSVRTGAVMRDLGALLEPLISDKIELRFRHAPEESHIFVDPAQLTQAMLNLAINATHAMPDGGVLTIASDVAQTEAGRHPSAQDGRFVTLSVSDTGTGIDAQTAEHIFEPFFSTKDAGKGTGLGLSMVHGMVDQSGGWIELDTEPGRGTNFTIFLPIAEPAQDAMLTRDGDAAEPLSEKGKGTILLVEDKDQVQALAAMTLKDLGYELVSAADGDEAAQIFADRSDAFDLLISDIAMPKKDGFALARELRTIRPDLKVVFMSGHAARESVAEADVPGDVEFLQKPFDPEQLARVVRGQLGGESHP